MWPTTTTTIQFYYHLIGKSTMPGRHRRPYFLATTAAGTNLGLVNFSIKIPHHTTSRDATESTEERPSDSTRQPGQLLLAKLKPVASFPLSAQLLAIHPFPCPSSLAPCHPTSIPTGRLSWLPTVVDYGDCSSFAIATTAMNEIRFFN